MSHYNFDDCSDNGFSIGNKTNSNRFSKSKSIDNIEYGFKQVDDSKFVEKYKDKKWCPNPKKEYSDNFSKHCKFCAKRLTPLLEKDLKDKKRDIVYSQERPCHE